MSRPHVAAVILAAGASTRLGRPKQLLDLVGRPLLQRTLDHVNASAADSVWLVLGARADAIRAAIEPGRAQVVDNPRWADGQSTSMRLGLDHAAPSADAVLFVLGDQPLILSTAIDAVIAAYAEGRPPIVQPTYAGQPGNPVLFDRSLFGQLRSVEGDQGAREVVRAHAGAVRRVAIADGSRPDDVDDEAAYSAVVAAWAARTR